jgi:hypothetical protein
MARITVRLNRSAAEKSRDPEAVRKAALAAWDEAGQGDIFCLPFEANGRRYALSSRMIIEIDWLPNRIPQRALRDGGRLVHPKRPSERR